jgi:HAD superfamily hydrolase (TIGR01509 family)
MTKAIIFDLDGVLIDSRETHYQALNNALHEYGGDKYTISKQEQETIYEGLTTRDKLEILTKLKGLPKEDHTLIWESKQEYSDHILEQHPQDYDLTLIFKHLWDNGIKIGIASNSIRKTLNTCLTNLGIKPYVTVTLSNEDVTSPKPNPEIYKTCMQQLGSTPQTTVIFEDSTIGKTAAIASGATLIEIKNRQDLTEKKIQMATEILNGTKPINILIPMAGQGSRFATAGYDLPKPLIDVNGKPMIQRVVENLALDANYIFIMQEEHNKEHNIGKLIEAITESHNIVTINGNTEGAAVTSLYAKDLINNDTPLVIANSDQIVTWNSNDFIRNAQLNSADGSITTFTSSHPKWSYVATDKNGQATQVAEKKLISNNATTGIYYWAKGSDYVKYAEQMIDQNIRTKGEFYIAPVYNEAIQDGKKIITYTVDEMHGIGTPEDLKEYLND